MVEEKTKKGDSVKVKKMKIVPIEATLHGTSPLIMHKWSEKAKKQIRDKEAKKVRGTKPKRNPKKEFNDARYVIDGKDAIPAICFKRAIVASARFDDDMKMTVLRGAIFVKGNLDGGEFVEIVSSKPVMREDVCRIAQGTSNLRYRPEYRDWSADIVVHFDKSVLSHEQVINLIARAGFSNGVGEWRPERNGQYGRFEIESCTPDVTDDEDGEIEVSAP